MQQTWVTLTVRVVGHGRPGEVHSVQGDERRLQQARAWLGFLYFGENRDNRHDDAEDEVQADEDFVFSAAVRLGVVHVEQHHSSEGTCVVQNGKGQQGSKPAPAPILSILHPSLVPVVGKIHQEDQLDQDKDEGAHHTKVVPHCVKRSVWNKKSSYSYPNQYQELEEPESILNGGSWVLAAAHSDHDEGEKEKEASHGETHPVHRLITHNDLTVDLALKARYGRALLTKSRNLLKLSLHTRHNHDDGHQGAEQHKEGECQAGYSGIKGGRATS